MNADLCAPPFLCTGCDCYAYGLLAAGHTDIVCEADLKPYDYMALVPVIKVRDNKVMGVLFALFVSAHE